jgi:hypothetical protein
MRAQSTPPFATTEINDCLSHRWRSNFKSDGATRFSEVAGGLNQMTIARFEGLVTASAFVIKKLDLVPIRALRRLHNRLTKEFTTALVRCRLQRR